MRPLRPFVLLLATLLATSSARAAEAYTPTGLDKLALYHGTWKVVIDHLDTPQSKASHEESTLRNDCWRSAGFYACNQIVNGESKAMLVFTYDAKADVYTSHVVPAEGSGGGGGTLLIQDNVWTFPWQSTENGKTTFFRVVNTMHGTDAIEFRQEYSTDNEHWTVTARGEEKRIG